VTDVTYKLQMSCTCIQKFSAPRGSVGGRNVPLMARKASLTTAKRPSVVDVNVPSTQQDPTGVRRASVATTGLSGNVGANRLTLSTSAAGGSSRAFTNRRTVAAGQCLNLIVIGIGIL
jgi:hypothetical protein